MPVPNTGLPGPGRLAAIVAAAADNALMAGRLARDLPAFLRAPTTLDDARRRIERQLAAREQRFLRLIERGVYARPKSPFLALLRVAGCEPGDLRALVAREGLEGALAILAERGVYLTHAEAKGYIPTVRGSQRLTFRPGAFDNPLAPAHLALLTGGSGRRPSRVGYSLAYFREMGESVAVVLAAHGVTRPRAVFWWPVPLWLMLMFASVGAPTLRWFYPARPLPWPARSMATYVRGLARLGGVTLPAPELCELAEPDPLVGYLDGELRRGDGVVLWVTASAGARVALAARARGASLRGLTVVVTSEPVTAARRDAVEAVGARVIAGYGSVDVTAPAYACAAPTGPDDLHAMTHRFAVISRPTPTVAGGPVVDALLVSSISETVPRIALNVMPGDYGRLAERDCDCALGALGLRTHLSHIGSHEKLTTEGVTFARSDLQRILEEVLPERFGGTLLDYQLAEDVTTTGEVRLFLRASPSIGPLDEAALRETLLREMGRDSMLGAYQARIWQGAGTIEIRREAPAPTSGGKVLPFQLLKQEPVGR